MTTSVSLDRIEIQTRPISHQADNSYCVWLRYEGAIAGRQIVDVQGPLTPEQAEAAGYPLDVVLGEVAATAIRQAEAAGAARIQAQLALDAALARVDALAAEIAAMRGTQPA